MNSLLKPKFLLYGIMMLVYGIILLVIKPQEPAVFFLWLFSVLLMVLRLRFGWMSRFIVFDLIIYLLWMWFDQRAFMMMIPSLMLLLHEGKMKALLLYVIIWITFDFMGIHTLLIMLISIISGLLLHGWHQDKKITIQTIDQLREKVYQSEIEREQLMQDQLEMSRLNILSERDRIAQKLHDDLGHELTGALLALRAFEATQKTVNEHPSFQALKTRLQGSIESLKATVHHTKPEETYGLERFTQMIEEINTCKVDYQQNGPFQHITATHWQLLISILKEAITNIQKHARPNEIQIELSVQNKVIRLSISNDGIIQSQNKQGVGLRYMRKRIESMGGSMTVQKTMFFTLLAILPMHREEGI